MNLKPIKSWVTPLQYESIKSQAAARKITISDFVRSSLIEAGVIEAAEIEIKHGDSDRFRKGNSEKK